MPLMLTLFGLVLDFASLSIVRTQLQAAADHGSLAGVQELDFDALALGRCLLNKDTAIVVARQYVMDNLSRSLSSALLGGCEITVNAYNPGSAGWHGNTLEYPTVCVEIYLSIVLPLTRIARVVRVHADASLVPRP